MPKRVNVVMSQCRVIPRPFLPALLIVYLLISTAMVVAQTTREQAEPDFNYVYGAVLGSGYYKSASEKLLILRIPLSFELPDSEWNTRILAPVAIGLRNGRDTPERREVSDNFATYSIMPGLAATFRLRENWEISPSAQLGIARDIKNNASSWVTSAAVRHHGWWDLDSSRLTLGQRLRFAGQRDRSGGNETAFILLEQGADWNFATDSDFRGNPIRGGVFLLWQQYFNRLNIEGVSPARVDIDRLFQLGITLGLERRMSIGGIPFKTIGISLSRGNSYDGNEIKAINISLGFPLTED